MNSNVKSRLLHFDWLFQTFWHWPALLSRCTKPWACWIIDSNGPMEENGLGTLTIIHYSYIFTQLASPHCTAAHQKNSWCSRWPVRPCTERLGEAVIGCFSIPRTQRTDLRSRGDRSCQASLEERTRKDTRTQNAPLWELRCTVFLLNWPQSQHKQRPMNNKYNILQTNVITY